VADTFGDYYTYASGTSFSCPLTAGAGALLWEMVPAANNMQIYEALKMSADNAGSPNNQYGWGIINVFDAYNYLLGLVGVDEAKVISQTLVFPNPSTNELFINTNSESKLSLAIFNLEGKLIKSIENYQSKQGIDISKIENGVYLCKVVSKEFTETQKFIISR
jgi:subtilisin family serine protease